MPLGNNKINREYHDPAGAAVTSAFSSVTDSIIDTHTAIKVLAITVSAEIGAFLMLYVAKDKVIEALEDSEGDVWIYASIAIFVVGLLTAFAAYRLIANKWPHYGSGIMIWFVSAAAGLANIGVFFVILTFRLR